MIDARIIGVLFVIILVAIFAPQAIVDSVNAGRQVGEVMWDASWTVFRDLKQACGAEEEVLIRVNDALVNSVNDPKTKQLLINLQKTNSVSLDILGRFDNIETLNELYTDGKIKILKDPCAIVSIVP